MYDARIHKYKIDKFILDIIFLDRKAENERFWIER